MACKKILKFNNGKIMPALGLGTWMAPDAEIEIALDQALEAGYRHIDAAAAYGNEPAIGRVLRKWIDSGKLDRNDLFITSKLPPPVNRPECVEKSLRSTLANLQLTYLDLFLVHTPFAVPETNGNDFLKHDNGDVVLDLTTDHLAIWKKMEEMVKLDCTKSIGVSNFNVKQLKRLCGNCTIRPVSLQIELHIYFQQNELVEFCRQHDIIVTAYSPLGSKGMAAVNKMAGIDRELPDLLENPEVLMIATGHNKTPAQILLRWIIQRGIAAIPKSTNPKRLRENLHIFNFELTSDEMDTLSKLDCGVRICDFGFFQGMNKHPEFPW